jgi:hypothetical protein
VFCDADFFFLSKKNPDEKSPNWITDIEDNPVLEKSG